MRRLLKIFFTFLIFNSTKAQLLFYQDTYKGGVTSDGVSYSGFDYLQADTINFQLHIASGSTIRKAYLFSKRAIFFVGLQPVKQNSVQVQFNGNTIAFDSSDVITNHFHCDNSIVSADIWMTGKDVTSQVLSSGNTLITPCQTCLMGADTSRHYVQFDFLLFVEYENNSLPALNTAVFLSNKNYSKLYDDFITNLNPIDNSKDVGLSIWTDNTYTSWADTSSKLTYTLQSSQGNYYLGLLDGLKDSVIYETLPGSFYYENNALNGLVDDTPDAFIDSTDALANIKTYIPNATTTFTLQSHGDTDEGCLDLRQGYILAYSTPCPARASLPTLTYTYCAGGNLQLNGNASWAQSYNWFPGGVLNDSTLPNPVASPTVTTNFVLTVTDSNNCHYTQHFKVAVYNNPKTDSIHVTPAICGGVNGTAIVAPAKNGTKPYQYNIGSGNQSNNTFSNLSPMTYSLSITDSVGCSYKSTFTVTQTNPAKVSFNFAPDTVCEGNSIQFTSTSTGINHANWFYNDTLFSTALTTAVHTFTNTATYTISLIGYNNQPQCSDTVTKTLFVHYCPPDSFVIIAPNIFTPNQDGLNDTWSPIISQYGYTIESFSLLIYDRWGVKVFESNDVVKGWGGRGTSGIECTEGTYYYVAKYTAISSVAKEKQATLKGFLQLIR